ncbi:hypothetical protein KW803_03880, partial [Candidatus Saccharibacteria bacterium]|nr:hypothetical protein [Candidatus Saccharibacteria bacterium]
NTCQPKAVYNRRQFKNLAGMVLWEYIQQIYFCTSNGYVTYFYRYRFGRIPSITPVVDWTVWEFDGNTNTNCGNEHCFKRGGKARSRTAWTQGKFHACLVLDKLMCNNQMPELSMTVYGTGGYSPWTKGG